MPIDPLDHLPTPDKAIKFDQGKPATHLISPHFIFSLAQALEFGDRKYPYRNWEKGMKWSRPFASLMRHLWAWWRGDKSDPETGFSHLWHAAACIMFLVHYEDTRTGTDDRPSTGGVQA